MRNIFFRDMTKKDKLNWDKGAIVGFYTYLFSFGINNLYLVIYKEDLISYHTIFYSGLVAAFVYPHILDLKTKMSKN